MTTMARYLIYTGPSRGHLYPLVPTLQELRGRGHEVIVMAQSSELATLGELGFRAPAIDPALERDESDDWRARGPAGALRRRLAVFARRAPAEISDLERALKDERPDALLIDPVTWGAAVVAEASGSPWRVTWAILRPPRARGSRRAARRVPSAGAGRRPWRH